MLFSTHVRAVWGQIGSWTLQIPSADMNISLLGAQIVRTHTGTGSEPTLKETGLRETSTSPTA